VLAGSWSGVSGDSSPLEEASTGAVAPFGCPRCCCCCCCWSCALIILSASRIEAGQGQPGRGSELEAGSRRGVRSGLSVRRPNEAVKHGNTADSGQRKEKAVLRSLA